MACFWAVMAAAPCSIICLNSAPVISLFILCRPPHRIMESTNTSTALAPSDAGVLVDHIPYLVHDGAAHGGNIDTVFHDDVQFNGNGLVLVDKSR